MIHRPPARVLVVAVGLPLAITVVGLALLVTWLPELPDPIAVHWGLDGPDGFASASAFVALYAVLGFGFVAIFGALAIAGRRVGPNWVQKMLAATSLGVSVVWFFTLVGTTEAQRGLDDAADAPDIGLRVIIGVAVGLLAGVIGWFIQPKTVPRQNELAAAEPLRLAPEERAVWLASTRTPVGVLVVIILAITFVLGVTVFLTVQTDGAAWPVLLAPIVLLALSLLTTSWRVRVDETGLVVRSVLGWPVYRVTVAEVAKAGATEISPGADFGGWGIRFAPGRRLGIVTRSGIALEAVRTDGSSLVVTVDDAATGAALLAAYAAAARSAE
jgi:hypothetical protein